MIAISYSDYSEYGCPECGSTDCFPFDGVYGSTTPAECRECGNRFMIVSNKLMISAIGYNSEGIQSGFLGLTAERQIELLKKYYNYEMNAIVDEEGFVFPIRISHPRKGYPSNRKTTKEEDKYRK